MLTISKRKIAHIIGFLIALIGFPAVNAQPNDITARPAPILGINKDLKNLGPDAYDIAVILSGHQTVTWHYDGYPNGHFSSFSFLTVGPNTELHWQNFWDGVDNIIQTGQIIHIGWGTLNPHYIKDMYWTDKAGKRIEKSKVCNIIPRIRPRPVGDLIDITFNNAFSPERQQRPAVTISDIRYIIRNTLTPLEDLNARNPDLDAENLSPIGDNVDIAAGDSARFLIQVPEIRGHMILRYKVSCLDSAAEAIDFVESNRLEELSINIASFKASMKENDKVSLLWEINEENNAGMNIWTAQIENGEFKGITQLNSELISTQTGGSSGTLTTYSKEYDMPSGVHYFMLEDINYDGVCTSHCDDIDAVAIGDGNPADIDVETAKMLCKQYTATQLATFGKTGSCIK
jgi:hypothetical protein